MVEGEIDDSGMIVVKAFTSIPRLVAELSSALENGGDVMFSPGHRSMRHFFNASGFISAMGTVAKQLPDADVVVPAGVYGGRWLVVFRKRT